MVKLIIGADIVPTASNQHLFENAHMEQIVDKALSAIQSYVEYEANRELLLEGISNYGSDS